MDALRRSAGVLREAHDEQPNLIDGGRATTDGLGPISRLTERIVGIFTPRKPVPRYQELSVKVLTGQFLVSLPILLPILVLRLALGTELAETANLALIALIAVNLIAALILRSGRVYGSGAVLTFALWATGTFISWTHPGILGDMVVFLLLAALIAFLVLPARLSLTLAILTMSSIAILELRGPGQTYVGSQTDRILALVGSLLAVCDLTFVVRESLYRALRQTLATQQALARSEEELSSILKKTPDIIYRLDSEGRIVYVNDAVRRYGYDPAEMVGTPILEYVHPEDRDLARHHVDERRTGDRSTKALEIRLLTRQGEERVAEYTAVPVFRETVFLLQAEGLYEDGTEPKHYLGTQGIARDITDRKRAEEALRKSEEKYSKVFQAAPAGFAITSLDEARFLDVNEEFERIFGYKRDELIGRSAFDIESWVDPDKREQIVNRLRRGEIAKDLEMPCHAKNGSPLTVRYNGHLIDIEGTACSLSAFEDITDRKRLESQLQQAQKLEAVGRLAGGIAHDFNNMLAVILGQAEIASGALAPTNPVYESIQEIRSVAESSAELTRQLLTFARKQDTAPRILDLNQAISERLGMLRRLIGENVELGWNPGVGLWSVRMDPTQVDQILINLAVNARDAIKDVGTLTISTENKLQEELSPQPGSGASPKEWVLLTVTDTGTGMDNDTLIHIFEPFFTTKEIGKGTGMGLATVYGIVQHCGGKIEVESELGKGTTFRVYLPRTLETEKNVHETEKTELARGCETLLVVEDEPAILKIVRMTLQRLGYVVMEAGSAGDALAAAAKLDGSLLLLLTDVVLPTMSGLDLYTRIAASHPGIKVIFMSGYSANVFPQTDDRTEHVSFLQKPFTMQQLSAKVREVLDRE
jgi:PAS domain S-box-containing protein